MTDFVGTFPSLKSVMGCHDDHVFPHSHNRYYGDFFRIQGDPGNNLAPNLKLPLGCINYP